MEPGNPKLSAMFVTDPKQAVATVVQAVDACNGNLQDTAQALHVGRSTLYRWIREFTQIRLSVQRILEEVNGDTEEDL